VKFFSRLGCRLVVKVAIHLPNWARLVSGVRGLERADWSRASICSVDSLFCDTSLALKSDGTTPTFLFFFRCSASCSAWVVGVVPDVEGRGPRRRGARPMGVPVPVARCWGKGPGSSHSDSSPVSPGELDSDMLMSSCPKLMGSCKYKI